MTAINFILVTFLLVFAWSENGAPLPLSNGISPKEQNGAVVPSSEECAKKFH